MGKSFEFQHNEDGSLSLDDAVFQALGAASVCWEKPEGSGVFDSMRAKEIGDALLEKIRRGDFPQKAPIVARQQDGFEQLKRLHSTTDARVWAEEFCSLFKVTSKDPDISDDGDDLGLMIGWFANAIEIGRVFGAKGPSQEKHRS